MSAPARSASSAATKPLRAAPSHPFLTAIAYAQPSAVAAVPSTVAKRRCTRLIPHALTTSTDVTMPK